MAVVGNAWDGIFDAGHYSSALGLSTQFYYAQYSGALPSNYPLLFDWRGDSFLNDGADKGVDLSGGFFDAGDLVKFGLPMAYTSTMLAWGGLDYKKEYSLSGTYTDLITHIGHLSDYFLRAYDSGADAADPSDDIFHVQVGDPGLWHNSYWGSAENAPVLPRVTLTASAINPAGDIAGETAAAMASASIIMRNEGNITLADELLGEAKKLFGFAETYPGLFTDSRNYYNSWDSNDELAWGATWLYKATGDVTYLNKAEQYANYLVYSNGADFPYDKTFGWASKDYGVAILLAEATGKQKYFDELETYFNALKNVQKMQDGTQTNEGLTLLNEWGTARYAVNAAFIQLKYAELLNARNAPGDSAIVSELINFASDQIDYVLGDNQAGQSYVVGFGSKYPQQPLHGGASGLNNFTDYWLSVDTPNAHILYGALVGGPSSGNILQKTEDGQYKWLPNPTGEYVWIDDRRDAMRNEVATDYNAGLSNALAALLHLTSASQDASLDKIYNIGGTYGSFFFGSAANEILFYRGSDYNYASGGAGTDTLVFSGRAQDYVIKGQDDHFTILGVGNTDGIQFTQFEYLTFKDFVGVSVADIWNNSGHLPGTHWADVINVGALIPGALNIGGSHFPSYFGTAADETLFYRGGVYNYASGGAGTDTLVFSGRAQDYTILGQDDHFTIRGIGTIDHIQFTQFEYLTFKNTAGVSVTDIWNNSGHLPGTHWADAINLGALVPNAKNIGGTYGSFFFGTEANDLLFYRGGDYNYASGGAGTDTLVFSGRAQDYVIKGQDDHFTILGVANTDGMQFTKFEYLTFKDVADVSVTDIWNNSGHLPGTHWVDVINIGALIPGALNIGGSHFPSYYGTAADETLFYRGGDYNYASGGAGTDTLVFSGRAQDYTILGQDDHFTIRAVGTTDHIQFTQFEYLRFRDTAPVSVTDIVSNSGHLPGTHWLNALNIGDLIPVSPTAVNLIANSVPMAEQSAILVRATLGSNEFIPMMSDEIAKYAMNMVVLGEYNMDLFLMNENNDISLGGYDHFSYVEASSFSMDNGIDYSSDNYWFNPDEIHYA